MPPTRTRRSAGYRVTDDAPERFGARGRKVGRVVTAGGPRWSVWPRKRRMLGFYAPQTYLSQTKILEGRTNISECVSPGITFQRCVAQIEYSHP